MKRNYTELKRLARETLTGHYTTPMLGLVISSLITDFLLLPFDSTLNDSTSQSVIFYAASFFISLLAMLFSYGLCYMHLNMRKKKPYGLKDVFYFFSHHPDRLILASLGLIGIAFLIFLPALICLAAAVYFDTTLLYTVTIILFCIFSIAALFILYNYAMVFYFLIDYPEMKVSAAFKESHRTMKGNKMRLFLLHLSFLGWFLLGVCSFCIGFLWIQPYFEQTMVSFYFELTGETDRLEAEKASCTESNTDGPHFQAYC